jgi:hypothetical protein
VKLLPPRGSRAPTSRGIQGQVQQALQPWARHQPWSSVSSPAEWDGDSAGLSRLAVKQHDIWETLLE